MLLSEFIICNATAFDGEVSELLEDMTNRAYYLAVCTKVENATLDDLTRKQLLQRRAAVRGQRMRDAILQSFTLEGLEKRYGWSPPNADPAIVPAPEK